MLTTDRIEAIVRTVGSDCVFAELLELCRVYAAVLGAPVGVVNTDDGDLVMVRLHDDEDRPDFTGKAVRLVPLGAGKGEG